jgi:hypothetical protein
MIIELIADGIWVFLGWLKDLSPAVIILVISNGGEVSDSRRH